MDTNRFSDLGDALHFSLDIKIYIYEMGIKTYSNQ